MSDVDLELFWNQLGENERRVFRAMYHIPDEIFYAPPSYTKDHMADMLLKSPLFNFVRNGRKDSLSLTDFGKRLALWICNRKISPPIMLNPDQAFDRAMEINRHHRQFMARLFGHVADDKDMA